MRLEAERICPPETVEHRLGEVGNRPCGARQRRVSAVGPCARALRSERQVTVRGAATFVEPDQ